MTVSRLVFLIIAAGTLIRLVLAGATGLGYDESYMVGNARDLALGYFDHPPLHVWITWAAERIFGSETALAVRFPFILLFAGSTWLMYRLTERLFGERAGLWAAVAFSLAPVFSFAHASWVLPDGPAIFFLLAAANVVVRILIDERPLRSPTLTWLAAGVLAGLAVLSKYNAAFFIVAVFVYLLTAPQARRHLATAGPWLAAVVAFVVVLPAIVWNLQHGLAGILFQAGRVGAPSVRLDAFAVNVAGQAVYLTPWLFVPFLISLVRALRAGTSNRAGWLMALAAVGPIAVFTLLALFARGLPHWSMPGWLFAIPLFGRDATALALRSPRFARAYMAVVAAIFAVLLGVFTYQATRGGLVPEELVLADPALEPTVDLVDWKELRSALIQRGLLTGDPVVGSPHWMFAGKASYALGPSVPVVCLCENPQQFGFRADQNQWAGKDVIVVVPGHIKGLWESAEPYFQGFEHLQPISITRAGKTVMILDLRLGKNLRFPQK